MILTILLVLLVLNAIILIVSIMLQPRSQGGVGAAFGVGVADNIFGGKGGMEFLTKLTAVLSGVFVVLITVINIYLAMPSSHRNLMKREGSSTATQQVPAEQGQGGQTQPQGQPRGQ